MLQITMTVTASQEKVMDEARGLERPGLVRIHEHIPNLVLNLPDGANEGRVIAVFARLSRAGMITGFTSKRVK
jgi:hypothetical protein